MRRKKFRGLFFNAVLALSLISLVPFVFIGVHLTRVNSHLLQHEIFQKQQAVAVRLSSVVQTYLAHTSEFFTVFLDLHTDFGGHAFLDASDLTYLQKKDSSITYLALLNTKGKQVLSSGVSQLYSQQQNVLPVLLNTCVNQHKVYMGPSLLSNEGWLVLMAFPVKESLSGAAVGGVLVAEVNLRTLAPLLVQAYPLDMEAFIVNDKHEIVAYNGSPGGLMSANLSSLDEQVQAMQEQLSGQTVGEVTMPSDKKWLVASATVPAMGWTVFVGQPANVASKLVVASALHSYGGLLRLLAILLLFIVGVSYWVIVPISRPVEKLRKAALRVRDGEAGSIERSDVDIPRNEIGDLAEVFVEMSHALYKRREDLLTAQRQLSDSNQELEKRVEERTRELKDATAKLVANERLATMGQMASVISHEIRNPLTVISNATRLIKMLVKTPDAKIEKQIGIIESEIKQANSIISEVLGYVRSREPILSKIEVNSYVHDILTSYPFAAGIKLVEKLEIMSVYVKIDTEEIKQAIRNLLANAVEAMQNQGTLTVGVKAGKDMVCIYVSDTGPGVPEDLRHKIFAPFFTTKARGTGLGLAVVGKAVNRHQGKLFITSEEGKGSCFQMYLKIYHQIGDTRYGETR